MQDKLQGKPDKKPKLCLHFYDYTKGETFSDLLFEAATKGADII